LTGFRAACTEDVLAKVALLRLRLAAAMLILTITAFRIVWSIRNDRKPSPIAGATLQLAGAVHVLLYVVVLGMVASGVGMTLASGAAPLAFSPGSSTLPDFWRYPPCVPHGMGARLFLGLSYFTSPLHSTITSFMPGIWFVD
jgi:cytochrome b561